MTATLAPQAQRFSRSDYKTLGLAALGGALEIYDFIIFVFFALTLSQLFFPPEMPEWLRLLQSFGIFVTGYLARPLGGILMAHFADHLGRKRVFSLSILMMALPCLLIGIMPTYAQIGYFAPLILLFLRVLQGAAVGGEVPSAWTFVAEHAPVHHRGYALGFLQAGLTFGYLLGALTATLLAQIFTAAEIPPDPVLEEDLCIRCMRCVEACPVNAVPEEMYPQGITDKKACATRSEELHRRHIAKRVKINREQAPAQEG